MSKVAVLRLLSDINEITKNPLDNNGIFVHVNENNIFDIKTLIIGPKDTPYYNGFYFFSLEFPKNYPLNPPIVKYKTLYEKIRFNPNLYTNGKVCLSLLNTWSGPSWTPCNTLSTILLSIRALVLINDPLRNEPEHENDEREDIENYNSILEYESIKGATIHMLNYIPKGFEMFKERIEKYFYENYEDYVKRITELKKTKNNKIYTCTLYNMNIKCDYEQLLKDVDKMYGYIKKKIE